MVSTEYAGKNRHGARDERCLWIGFAHSFTRYLVDTTLSPHVPRHCTGTLDTRREGGKPAQCDSAKQKHCIQLAKTARTISAVPQAIRTADTLRVRSTIHALLIGVLPEPARQLSLRRAADDLTSALPVAGHVHPCTAE
jgi:hypothetical protein